MAVVEFFAQIRESNSLRHFKTGGHYSESSWLRANFQHLRSAIKSGGQSLDSSRAVELLASFKPKAYKPLAGGGARSLHPRYA